LLSPDRGLVTAAVKWPRARGQKGLASGGCGGACETLWLHMTHGRGVEGVLRRSHDHHYARR
jgi:hypothetical protein